MARKDKKAGGGDFWQQRLGLRSLVVPPPPSIYSTSSLAPDIAKRGEEEVGTEKWISSLESVDDVSIPTLHALSESGHQYTQGVSFAQICRKWKVFVTRGVSRVLDTREEKCAKSANGDGGANIRNPSNCVLLF